jgi:hypothetical protein
MNIKHATSLSVRQIAQLPDHLKLAGLSHDISECLLSDIPSPYKNRELRQLELRIFAEMSKHLKLRLPTKHEHIEIKHADRRARQGEIWSGVGDRSLRPDYPVRDREAERLTVRYARRFKPADCIRKNGAAVKEYCRRWEAYKKLQAA